MKAPKMNKKAALAQLHSGHMDFETLQSLLEHAGDLGSPSVVNRGMARRDTREILKRAIEGRTGKISVLRYSPAQGREVTSRDALIAVNILRDFG